MVIAVVNCLAAVVCRQGVVVVRGRRGRWWGWVLSGSWWSGPLAQRLLTTVGAIEGVTQHGAGLVAHVEDGAVFLRRRVM